MVSQLREAAPGRVFVGRLPTGSDLTTEVERYCAEHSIPGTCKMRVPISGRSTC